MEKKLTRKDLIKDHMNVLWEFNNGVHHIVCTYDISLYVRDEEHPDGEFIHFKKFPKDFNLPAPSKEEMKEKFGDSSQYGPKYEGRFEFWDLNGTVPDNKELFGKSYSEFERDDLHHYIKDLKGNLRVPAKVEWLTINPGPLMVYDFQCGFIQNSTYWTNFDELKPRAQNWFNAIVCYALTGMWDTDYLLTFKMGKASKDSYMIENNIYM